jgi:hypothetical protein
MFLGQNNAVWIIGFAVIAMAIIYFKYVRGSETSTLKQQTTTALLQTLRQKIIIALFQTFLFGLVIGVWLISIIGV